MRGTSRREGGLVAIEAAGIEPALADPADPGSVLDLIGDIAVVAWLLGSATGGAQELSAIHGPCLERVLGRLVETPVRGFLYEASGSVAPGVLARGVELAGAAAETWRIPLATIGASPAQADAWLDDALSATLDLAGRRA